MHIHSLSCGSSPSEFNTHAIHARDCCYAFLSVWFLARLTFHSWTTFLVPYFFLTLSWRPRLPLGYSILLDFRGPDSMCDSNPIFAQRRKKKWAPSPSSISINASNHSFMISTCNPSAWNPNNELRQSMLCNLWGAIYVVQHMGCNICGAIYGVQYMGCNLCSAIYEMQSMGCNIWCAIFGMQYMVYIIWDAIYVVQSMVCNLCDAIYIYIYIYVDILQYLVCNLWGLSYTC